jgi:hypothetical protein
MYVNDAVVERRTTALGLTARELEELSLSVNAVAREAVAKGLALKQVAHPALAQPFNDRTLQVCCSAMYGA